MATYEVLEPGGHARLVSDIKDYANRASGVGTTQIADESVTSAKLADDVTDTLDHVESFTDPMNKNGLHGELAEGALLIADDVYAAPPRDVDVYGASTQVTTTGKNLLNRNGEESGYIESTGYVRAYDGWFSSPLIAVVAGSTYTFNPNSTAGSTAKGCFYDSNAAPITDSVFNSGPITVTAPQDAAYVRVSYRDTSTNVQFELGSTATSYEPYTGGKAAPRPDWPQEIKSVDDLTLTFASRNIFDASKLVSVGGWTESNGAYTGTPKQLYQNFSSHTMQISCAANTQYVLSFTQTAHASGSSGNNLNSKFAYSDGTTSSNHYTNSSDTTYAFTSDAGKTVVGISFAYSQNYSMTIENIQLVTAQEWAASTSYTPYVAPASVSIPLPDHSLRSLPDGKKDELDLTYLRPSTRSGWAWYSETLVQRVVEVDLGTKNWIKDTNVSWNTFYSSFVNIYSADDFDKPLMCTAFKYSTAHSPLNIPDESVAMTNSASTPILRIKSDDYYSQYDATQFKAAVNGVKLQYALPTPQTHDLGEVELPVMPSEHATVWCDGGSAQPTLRMGYERDVNIVISNMMSVIADAATS